MKKHSGLTWPEHRLHNLCEFINRYYMDNNNNNNNNNTLSSYMTIRPSNALIQSNIKKYQSIRLFRPTHLSLVTSK
jgi:hypothetical protein